MQPHPETSLHSYANSPFQNQVNNSVYAHTCVSMHVCVNERCRGTQLITQPPAFDWIINDSINASLHCVRLSSTKYLSMQNNPIKIRISLWIEILHATQSEKRDEGMKEVSEKNDKGGEKKRGAEIESDYIFFWSRGYQHLALFTGSCREKRWLNLKNCSGGDLVCILCRASAQGRATYTDRF